MQLTCPHCLALCDFSDRRPVFCPFCGKPLLPEDPTLPLPPPAVAPSEAATLAAAPQPAADKTDDPDTIGGYRLLRVLGVGGMGKVYEAEDVATGRRVALKLVSADYARAADAVDRFRQEGRLASLIAHPRCVFVLAADEENGRPYIVMELMPGDNLDDYIRVNGPQSPTKAVRMILDVIEGLQEAHRVGVIHRDVKPSNCFFGDDGRLKVGDFGLSKSLAQGAHLTKTGSFLGTPLYASPEQVRGEPLDAQTDVYSVAATLYYLLTGRAPFQSDNAAVTLARIAADPALSMRTLRPELSPALDAVVLQGLERDHKNRWQNLDEFADALRPFLPGRSSLVGLGVRFGALALDYGILMLTDNLVQILVATAIGYDLTDPRTSTAVSLLALAMGLVVNFLYFGLFEGLLGWSPGKRLLGLRVRQAATGLPPGLARGLTRAFCFDVLVHLGQILALFILLPLLHLEPNLNLAEAGAHLGAYMLFAVSPIVGFAVGVFLLLCTMRPGNGYRGLHEFLSGTSVARVPHRRPWAVAVESAKTLTRSDGVPEKIGTYYVRGAFRWDAEGGVLLGNDAALGRQVVLWLRPADQPPLSAARREVNRTGRLRWLAAGILDGRQWDAFVAAGGGPLAALVATNGPLRWPHALPLLKQLTDELLDALKDETLPTHLEPEQVWVQSDGRLVLLDTPFMAAPGTDPADDIPEKAALKLLARVAVLALENRSVKEVPNTIRAPVPLPAAAALQHFTNYEDTGFRLRDFRERLNRLQDKPSEVTRARRAGQLALLTLFLLLCGGCCLSPAGSIMDLSLWLNLQTQRIARDKQALDDLDMAAAVDEVRFQLNPSPPGGPAVLPDPEADRPLRARFQADLEHTQRKLDSRAAAHGAFGRAMLDQQRKQQEAMGPLLRQPTTADPAVLRKNARGIAVILDDPQPEEKVEGTCCLPTFLIVPSLLVVEAFALRGGLSFLVAGLALVRRDGRRAGWFRCAWRALPLWVPVVVMLFLSRQLDAWYWSVWETPAAPPHAAWALLASAILWWGTWLLLVVYVLLALRYPTRTPLDWLAGTYVVPAR